MLSLFAVFLFLASCLDVLEQGTFLTGRLATTGPCLFVQVFNCIPSFSGSNAINFFAWTRNLDFLHIKIKQLETKFVKYRRKLVKIKLSL